MQIPFDKWKAEFEPHVYEDTEPYGGGWCYEHNEGLENSPELWCDCEFLRTYDTGDDDEWAELKQAVLESRVWSWRSNGRIVNGMYSGADYLITNKQWTEEIEVI